MPKIGTTAHSSTHDAMWLVHTALSTSEVAGLTGRVTEAIHRRHHKSMLRGKQVHARMTRSTSSTIQPTRGSSQLDRPAHRACSRVVLEHLQCIPLTARITPLLRLPPPTLPGAEGSPPCTHASSRGDALISTLSCLLLLLRHQSYSTCAHLCSRPCSPLSARTSAASAHRRPAVPHASESHQLIYSSSASATELSAAAVPPPPGPPKSFARRKSSTSASAASATGMMGK